MAQRDNVQLTSIIVATPAQAAELERIFESHAAWMEATHHRSGKKALLSYSVSKGPELANPMDPTSAPTGNTCFVLTEVYETEAGVRDHFDQAGASWKDFAEAGKVLEQCRTSMVPAARIIHSLW